MNNIEKKLKILAVGDPAVYAYIKKDFNIINSFEMSNNVEVDFNIIEFSYYYNKMYDSLQSSHEYDIVMIAGHLWLHDFVKNGFLAPVNFADNYHEEDFLLPIGSEIELNGIPYLYPSFCDGHVLVYRKSIIEQELGIKLSSVVDTDTIISLANKANGIQGMNGIALKAHSSEIFLDFLPYLRNENIDAFDSKNHSPSFNNNKGLLALNKYIHLQSVAPKRTVKFGNEEVMRYFQNKKVAMMVTWGGQLGFVMGKECIDKEDVGFAAVKTAWNVTWGFAIDSHSTNQKIANKFLSYLTSGERDSVIGSYAGSPLRKKTYETDNGIHPWYPVHLELIEKYATPLPKMNNSVSKQGPLYEHLYLALLGKEMPEEALREAEKEIIKIECRGNIK